MTDEQLLDRLRHDLDELVGEPGPAPELGTVAVGPVRAGRSPWLLIAAAAAISSVIAGGLLVLQRGADAPVTTEHDTLPLGPEVVEPQIIDPAIIDLAPPVPPTPAGWTVVEWGDVRLSLPPDLDPYGPGCRATTGRELALTLTCGDRELTIVSATAVGIDPDRPGVVRNGLRTDLVPVPDLDGPMQLLVDETASLVRFVGFGDDEIDAIADTVGVSSVWRVRLQPAPPVPDGWQTIQLDGFSFRVPPNWGVSRVGANEIDRDVCGFGGVLDRNVLLGRGSLQDATVSCVGDGTLVPAVDGVRVIPQDDEPDQLLNAYVAIVIGSVDPPQVVRIGLGGDGTIGRTIFGSVVETSNAAPTASTVPATTVPTPSTVSSTTPPIVPGFDGPEYEGTGSVFRDGSATWLCIADLSYPAACYERVELVNWMGIGGVTDTSTVGVSEWVAVRGTVDLDSRTMAVTDARFVDPATAHHFDDEAPPIDFSTVCPPPDGGWVYDPANGTALSPGVWSVVEGYAVHWWDGGTGVWNLRLTGDVDRATAAIRAFYGGPLCVTNSEYSADELEAIRQTILDVAGPNHVASSAGTDARSAVVRVSVVTPMPELQQQMDEQYGTGLVLIEPLLVLANGAA